MPFDGSGNYAPISAPDFPAVASTTIRASQYNNQINDIADALSNCLTRDGQSTASANQPMGGMKHTNVAAATARTQYARAAEVQDGSITYLTSVAGTDTITAVGPLTLAAYATGQVFRFKAAAANSGAVTLNINSIGAKPLTYDGATALKAAELTANTAVEVFYDGVGFQLLNHSILAHEAALNPHPIYLTQSGLAAHTGDTTDAHDASAISYAGSSGLLAADVEAALDELDLEKAPKGLITGAQLTMNTARLLGRFTANVGVVEELQIGVGLSLSGGVLSAAGLIKQIVSTTIAAATGTTIIPDDNTEPLSTEGTQVASLTITPSSASNKVRVRGNFSAVISISALSDAGQGGLIAAVFRGSTLVGTARTLVKYGTGDDWGANVAFEFEDSPASASALTYTVRVGEHGTGNNAWYVNRSSVSATALASSMANSIFTAEEISV